MCHRDGRCLDWHAADQSDHQTPRLHNPSSFHSFGRLVTQQQLLNVYQRLGLDCDIQFSPQEVLEAVMEQRTSLTLLSGNSLRRSLVMGQPRLELTGISPSDLLELKVMGCFTEIIQWKTRVFVPMNDMTTLTRILDKYPVGHQSAGSHVTGTAA